MEKDSFIRILKASVKNQTEEKYFFMKQVETVERHFIACLRTMSDDEIEDRVFDYVKDCPMSLSIPSHFMNIYSEITMYTNNRKRSFLAHTYQGSLIREAKKDETPISFGLSQKVTRKLFKVDLHGIKLGTVSKIENCFRVKDEDDIPLSACRN